MNIYVNNFYSTLFVNAFKTENIFQWMIDNLTSE